MITQAAGKHSGARGDLSAHVSNGRDTAAGRDSAHYRSQADLPFLIRRGCLFKWSRPVVPSNHYGKVAENDKSRSAGLLLAAGAPIAT